MAKFSRQWSRDAWAFRVVSKGLTWGWCQQPPPYKPFLQEESLQLEDFLKDLLEAGAVEQSTSLLFQGPLFSVPKKNSTKRRVILDLSTLNHSINCPSFKMTTLQDVRNLLTVGSFMTSIDLKDAYWHVPIHRSFRKYLGFRLGKRKYQFRVLPFGLNIAPRVFTKLTKPILQELRLLGIGVLVYLDDWLVWGRSRDECLRHTKLALEVIQRRGFVVNFDKSHLVPSDSLEWLGIQWDARTGHMSLPGDKVVSLRQDLRKLLRRRFISRRDLERMYGKLQFASLVDPVGKALLKSLNWTFRSLARKGLRDRRLPFPLHLKASLRRWLRPRVLESSLPFRPPPPSVDVFTDASQKGWGVHDSVGRRLMGVWSASLRGCHINILELVAVYLAIKRLWFPRGVHLRLHSDNMTVVNCLSRGGSARSVPLNRWIISILHLLQQRQLVLTACHIAGVRNVIADGLSRNSPLPSEWSLDEESFRLMCHREFVPQVDLFATRENRKLDAYVSPVPDRWAIGVDAFSIDWNQWESIYLFPPTSQLLKVLVLLQHFRGRALLVTPDWPNQAWYHLAQRLSRGYWHLPRPRLSQRVGDTTTLASSKMFQHLLCWSF